MRAAAHNWHGLLQILQTALQLLELKALCWESQQGRWSDGGWSLQILQTLCALLRQLWCYVEGGGCRRQPDHLLSSLRKLRSWEVQDLEYVVQLSPRAGSREMPASWAACRAAFQRQSGRVDCQDDADAEGQALWAPGGTAAPRTSRHFESEEWGETWHFQLLAKQDLEDQAEEPRRPG